MDNSLRAGETFDLKLFLMKCMKNLWVILACILLGSLVFGGVYYFKNVTMAGEAPNQLTYKYYLTYGVDPSDQQTYSYFAGYTWGDFLRSDASMERILKSLKESGFSEGIAPNGQDYKSFVEGSFTAGLESDLRILYLTVTGKDPKYLEALSLALEQEMYHFPQDHKEILQVERMSTGNVTTVKPDIRTFRAFVLGAVLGGFFAIFGVGFVSLTEDSFDVPITLQNRFSIPVIGYVTKEGRESRDLSEKAKFYLDDLKKIAVTSLDHNTKTDALMALIKKSVGEENREIMAIPGVFDEPEGLKTLVDMDAVLISVEAGKRNGKALSQLVSDLTLADVKIKAFVLTGADEKFIRTYLFPKQK